MLIIRVFKRETETLHRIRNG